MNSHLRIAVADDEPRMCEFYRQVLNQLGHDVVCEAHSGQELVQQCRQSHPDLVLVDVKMPDLDGIEAAHQIWQDAPTAIILVSGHHEPELLDRAGANHVLAYLIKPIKLQDLQPAITIAMHRFHEFQALHKEAEDLRQALHDRKIIERAKGILMKRHGMDEATAFLSLQKLARDKNRKLVQIAEMIITVEEAFSSPP
jgi:AmiR/NasT family two-component response regulator